MQCHAGPCHHAVLRMTAGERRRFRIIFDEFIPLSDVVALVAATEPSKVSLASSLSGSTSQAPHPSFGGAVVEPAAGSAHGAFQPDPGHVKNDGLVRAGLDAAPPTPSLPPPLLVRLARFRTHTVG